MSLWGWASGLDSRKRLLKALALSHLVNLKIFRPVLDHNILERRSYIAFDVYTSLRGPSVESIATLHLNLR